MSGQYQSVLRVIKTAINTDQLYQIHVFPLVNKCCTFNSVWVVLQKRNIAAGGNNQDPSTLRAFG